MANNPIFSGFCPLIVEGSSESAPPPPPADRLMQGVYGKVEYNQSVTSKATWFPDPYVPASHATSIFGYLDNKAWLKGILEEVNFGEFDDGAGGWNDADLIHRFDTIKALGKKIMILIPLKVTELDRALRLLPSDLDQTSGTYDGSTIIYDNLWGYLQGASPKGYHMKLEKFRASQSSTYKTRFFAFLQYLADNFANNPTYEDTFAGIMTSESASMDAIDGSIQPNTGTGRNNHFAGRLNVLKQMRIMFHQHMVIEDCNFDATWNDAMTDGSADGLIDNAIAFTQSNFHTGTNMTGWTNINLLVGTIPIIAQAQGLELDSRSGERAAYYDYPDNLIPGAVWPDSTVTNTEDTVPPVPAKQDPATAQWSVDRANHFLATHLIIQINTAGSPNKYGTNRTTWANIVSQMDASAYANDPQGGITTRATTIVTG